MGEDQEFMEKVSIVIRNHKIKGGIEEYGSVEIDDSEREEFIKHTQENGKFVKVLGE